MTEVAERWPELVFREVASGYRYVFVGPLATEPLCSYEHLILQHHRRTKRLIGTWEYSYFRTRRTTADYPKLTVRGGAQEHHLLDEQDWNPFFQRLAVGRKAEFEKLKTELLENDPLHCQLWDLFCHRQLRDPEEPATIECLKMVLAQPDFSMTVPTCMKLDGLLTKFKAEGSTTGEGQFTLESSRARAKLSKFQLSDPQLFIIHLIAGAIAGGAPEVKVYVDSDDIVVEFAGDPLGKDDLTNLPANLLAGHASGRDRELAVALTAASSLRPKSLRLESWHGEWGYRMEVGREQESVTELLECPFETERAGHRVHFRDNPSLRVVKRFLNSIRREHPEIDLVRERCRWAPVPVLLHRTEDVRSLDFSGVQMYRYWRHPHHPLNVPLDEQIFHIIEESPLDASVLMLLEHSSALEIVVNGISYPAPRPFRCNGLRILVADNSAHRDLSFGAVVADKRWSEIEEFLRQARDLFLKSAVERYGSLPLEEHCHWCLPLQRLLKEGAMSLVDVPMFKKVGGEIVCLSTLLNANTIQVTGWDWEYGLRSGEPVFVVPEESIELLQGRLCINVDSELAQNQGYFQAYHKWLQLPPSEEIRFAYTPVFSRPIKGREGEFALTESPRQKFGVHLYALGRPLFRVEVDEFPCGAEAIVNDDCLASNDEWTDVIRDKEYARVIKMLEMRLDGFFQAVMESGVEHTEVALRYLLHLKTSGRPWQHHRERIQFKTRIGDRLTLADLLNRVPITNHSSMQEMVERAKDRINTLLLPVHQQVLLQQLMV